MNQTLLDLPNASSNNRMEHHPCSHPNCLLLQPKRNGNSHHLFCITKLCICKGRNVQRKLYKICTLNDKSMYTGERQPLYNPGGRNAPMFALIQVTRPSSHDPTPNTSTIAQFASFYSLILMEYLCCWQSLQQKHRPALLDLVFFRENTKHANILPISMQEIKDHLNCSYPPGSFLSTRLLWFMVLWISFP